LISHSEDEDEETKHYFLRNRQRFTIGLNVNGISIARAGSKLGIQRNMLVPKSLTAICRNATGTVVSLIDCLIVKKYPITYAEFRASKGNKEKSRVVNRCLQTVEYIQGKYQNQDLSYRTNFKLLVVDGLKPYASALISLQSQT
jgi:hypothetical protein